MKESFQASNQKPRSLGISKPRMSLERPHQTAERLLNCFQLFCLVHSLVFILLKRSQELMLYGLFNLKSCVFLERIKCIDHAEDLDGWAFLLLNLELLGFLVFLSFKASLDKPSWFFFKVKAILESAIFLGNAVLASYILWANFNDENSCKICSGEKPWPYKWILGSQAITLLVSFFFIPTNVFFYLIKKSRIAWTKSRLISPLDFHSAQNRPKEITPSF